jgi:Xaa-Pro aminopeptidase
VKPGVKWPTFPYDEYRSRVERAKQCLDRHELDAMLLFSPTNWHYYGGFTDAAQMHNRVWRTCLLVCRERDPVAVAHVAFGAGLATMSYVEDVRLWADADNPLYAGLPRDFYNLLFDTLRTLGLANRTLGIETGSEIDTYLSFDEYAMIQRTLSQARIVSADAAIWEQRMIKSPFEQELMREGARLACECVRTAFNSVRPGTNERDLHRAYWTKAAELGMIESPSWGSWTCFTSNASEPMGFHRWITGPVDRVIEVGDVGLCDSGLTYKGYQFDFQRSFCVGEPPEKLRRYHQIGTEAHLETIDRIKPGVRMCDLFQASLDALRKRDYPYPHFISFIGHQEGLCHHEPPWVTAAEEAVCQPGMVVAIEIGAFDQKLEVFGAMPEDILLVTENGYENLTASLPHDLWVVS